MKKTFIYVMLAFVFGSGVVNPTYADTNVVVVDEVVRDEGEVLYPDSLNVDNKKVELFVTFEDRKVALENAKELYHNN